MNKRKQTIIFSIFLFAVSLIVLSYILYKHPIESKPIYFDAPIHDFEDKPNIYNYDENNALNILRNMDEGGLDVEETKEK